jgi:signal transduction histidine kinase
LLRLEVEELRASRRRLVLAADADRRMIERDLHERVQQHLVALAVNLQLASQSADADPAAAKALLEEMGRDVQRALDEAARLAERIYPPLLESGGLGAVLRSAAASAGISVTIEIEVGAEYPPEVARTVYLCWLDALGHARAGTRAKVTVQDENGKLAFEIVTDTPRPEAELDWVRDRVDALGGRLEILSAPAQGTRFFGTLPC